MTQPNTKRPQLSQLQKDLGQYADDKLYNAMKDIAQAFFIAERPMRDALACCATKSLYFALDVFADDELPLEKVLQLVSVLYEQVKSKQQIKESAKDEVIRILREETEDAHKD